MSLLLPESHVWTVLCLPVEEDGTRGLGVFITDGDGDEREVGRVAFIRSQASEDVRDKAFADQLDAVIERADAACEMINDTLTEVERLQHEHERERVQREDAALKALSEKLKDAVGFKPRPSKTFS